MDADKRRSRLNELSEAVIGCCYTVGNALGLGFLVERSVLLELKAVSNLEEVHFAQCMNYLKATGLRLCLLVNFGKPRIQIRRVVNEF